MPYDPEPALTRDQIEAALLRADPLELAVLPLAAALYGEDWRWAQGVCLRLARHADPAVRGAAMLGFGHVARVHGRLDAERVEPVLRAARRDPEALVRIQAESALEDLRTYLPHGETTS